MGWHGAGGRCAFGVRGLRQQAAAKRNVCRAIESVAQRLGNTPTICRKCYVHPEILQSYIDGELVQTLKKRIERELAQRLGELAPAEAATLALLHRRLNGGAKKSRRAQFALVKHRRPAPSRY